MYRVFHAVRESGADFIVPPPPPAVLDNPNVRHGVIDRPDPHRVDDKARLLAQIEMDQGRLAAWRSLQINVGVLHTTLTDTCSKLMQKLY